MADKLNRQMRILHITKYDSGGATEYAKTLSDGLQRYGIDSKLFDHHQYVHAPQSWNAKTNRILNRFKGRFYVEIQKQVFHPTNRLREFDLKQVLNKFDLVHVHQVANWMGLDNLFDDLLDIPVIVSLHDLWPITGGCVVFNGCERYRNECSGCPALRIPFGNFLAKRQLQTKRRVYDREDIHFVANSQWTYDKMQRATALGEHNSISIIHPAVDLESFKPADKGLARKDLGLPENAFVVCVGAASITDENKNIADALLAVAQSKLTQPVIVLVFGDGHLEPPDRLDVRFLGAISSRTKLATIYNASDVFISTSKMETYGMTLIESMACGTPVVAYRTGAIPHVIIDGESGKLVELNNRSGIASALCNLQQDSKTRMQLQENALRLVSKRNHIKNLVDQHIKLYRRASLSA